jgi:hypothetical protein
MEIESVLLANASRWFVAGAPGVGLIYAQFVAPSDEVVVLWTTITKSHSTVIDTDRGGTT